MNLKSICLAIVFISVISFSCRDDEYSFQSTGLILGPDIGFCPCCGGYIIEITDSTYHFDSLPASSEINLSTATFPIEVKLDWAYERKCGGFQYIEIARIEVEN